MINNVVNSRGGLHNRLTGYINLKPFTLNEYDNIYRSLFNKPEQYIKIIEALTKKQMS